MTKKPAFDLEAILREASQDPPPRRVERPYALEWAAAVINDVIRDAGGYPIRAERWRSWSSHGKERWLGQLSALAHLLRRTQLGPASVATLAATEVPLARNLISFFEAIEPLTSELIASSGTRCEELLRRWILALDGRVRGESLALTRRRAATLDYREVLAELARAEEARVREAAAKKASAKKTGSAKKTK